LNRPNLNLLNKQARIHKGDGKIAPDCVTDEMTYSEPNIGSESSLAEAARLMAQQEVEVLVLEDNIPVGILRNIDLVKAIAGGANLEETKVREAMVRPPPIVREGAKIREVIGLAHRVGARRVYVTAGDRITGHVDLDELSNMMANSWDDIEVHKALSTMIRLRIAELLSTRYMGVEQIAEEIGVKAITVRHHLDVLRRSGIIEIEEVHGKVGRPRALFKATDLVSEGFHSFKPSK
jgi:signal-transduction protein with cAMP-binding, CBS, and nucleotidyltransferase domain